MASKQENETDRWLRLQPWFEPCHCPECGHSRIEYELVGYPESRMGYALLWCPACHKGMNISRFKVPDGVAMLSFEQAENGEGKERPAIDWV